MVASFEQKKMCFLKLIDKERDFEHLKKISVVDIKKYSCENIDVYHTVFSTFPGDIFYADDWNCKWK